MSGLQVYAALNGELTVLGMRDASGQTASSSLAGREAKCLLNFSLYCDDLPQALDWLRARDAEIRQLGVAPTTLIFKSAAERAGERAKEADGEMALLAAKLRAMEAFIQIREESKS